MNHKVRSTGLIFGLVFGAQLIMVLLMSLNVKPALGVGILIAMGLCFLWFSGVAPHYLGATCSFLNLREQAEPLYLLAMNNFKSFAWPNQSNVDEMLLGLVDCYLKRGKVSEAITATRNWVRWKETAAEKPEPGHSQTWEKLSRKLWCANYYEEADAVAVELIEHRQNRFGVNHESVAEARLLRANFRPESLDAEVAKQEYLKALAIFRSALCSPASDSKSSLTEIVSSLCGISNWKPDTLNMALSCSLSLADLHWGSKDFALAHQTLADAMSLADQYSHRHTLSSRTVCRQIAEIQKQNQVT